MIGLIAVDSILRQCALSPGIDAAHTMNVEVDIQIHKTATLDFVRMLGGFKILLAIIPGTDA